MQLGINSYTLMWSIGFMGVNPAFPEAEARPASPLGALDLLEIARANGLHLFQSGPNLDLTQLPRPYLDRFLIEAARQRITLELGTRGLDLPAIQAQVALALRCGARLIRTLPELDGRPLTSGRELAAALPPLLPLLRQAQVWLGIENGRIPATELAEALETAGEGQVGVVLDTVNSLAIGEGWREVTRVLAPHVMCLHYKDFTLRRAWHMMGFICEGVPAGEGMLDLPWLLGQLSVSRYPFNVILEQWTPEQDSIAATVALEQAWLPRGIAFLRNTISG